MGGTNSMTNTNRRHWLAGNVAATEHIASLEIATEQGVSHPAVKVIADQAKRRLFT